MSDLIIDSIEKYNQGHDLVRIATKLIGADLTDGPFIAGGSVRRFIENTSVLSGNGDIDIFFKNRTQRDLVAGDLNRRNTCKRKRNRRHQPNPYCSNNSTTYDFWYDEIGNYFTIQLIHSKYFGSISELFDTFDFTICELVTDGRQVIFGDRTKEDLRTKTIRFRTDEIDRFVNTPKRFLKYMFYGYTPAIGTVSKTLKVFNPDLIHIDAGYVALNNDNQVESFYEY